MLYKELEILQRVSHTILNNQDVHSLLEEILDIMDKDVEASRATLTLFDGHVLKIVASKGLTPAESKRGQYTLGEGVTGQVAKDRVSILIPDISKDENFLNRTESRKNTSVAFICSPIIKNKDLIGTISVDLDNKDTQYIEKYHKVIDIIANLIADAVSVIRDEAKEKEILKSENSRLIQELNAHFSLDNIIGSSMGIKQACQKVRQLAENTSPVLICGEKGVGKKLFAKSIHYNGQNSSSAFVILNGSLIPESLLESDIFGIIEQNQEQEGYLSQAEKGTLFIEEIADLPLTILNKLEKFLAMGFFTKVNSSKKEKANIRLIVSTSADLNRLQAEGKFPPNLYERLSINTIILPKLIQRKNDITLLAEHFLKVFNKQYGEKIKRFSTPAIDMFLSYHWPGNVQELYNYVEQAFIKSSNDVINGYDLPAILQTQEKQSDSQTQYDLVTSVNNYEREFIIEALKKHRGNAANTARYLNTTPRVLNYKFNKLNINLKSYKPKK